MFGFKVIIIIIKIIIIIIMIYFQLIYRVAIHLDPKLYCWALLFIFKLRFPPGVSIATVLKSRQNFHYSLKEHHKISNIPKFRCEML